MDKISSLESLAAPSAEETKLLTDLTALSVSSGCVSQACHVLNADLSDRRIGSLEDEQLYRLMSYDCLNHFEGDVDVSYF